MEETWVITLLLAFAALLGAAVGSFLNVCIYRLPREGLSVSRPRRSFCPSCGSSIRWDDNIPLLSWILLRGRCRHCQAPISSRYVLVEALTAVLFFLVARRHLVLEEISLGAAAATLALVSGLVVASFVDLELRIIPDEITLGGMALVPLVALLVPDLQGPERDACVWGALARAQGLLSEAGVAPRGCGPLWGWPLLRLGAVGLVAGVAFCAGRWAHVAYWRRFQPAEPRRPLGTLVCGVLAAATAGLAAFILVRPDRAQDSRVYSLAAALWGMLIGGGLVFLVGVVGSKVFRKPAMGLGDVKLMGLLGAFTGWIGAVEGFFVACFLGSIVGIFVLLRSKSRYLPFGPFLALGCLLVILWPGAFERALDWYLGLFRS